MRNLNAILLFTALVGSAGAVQAATATITVGDADCFGEPDDSACVAGAFPTIPSFDNAMPGDPTGTDVFDTLGDVMLDFFIDLAGMTAANAQIELRLSGVDIFIEDSIGDAIEGMGFTFNGSLIGTYFSPVVIGSDINQRSIDTLVFSVPTADLIDGAVNTLILSPEQDFDLARFEAFAVDYATLSIAFAQPPMPAIPLPPTATLLGAAAGALVLMRRKKAA